MFLLQREAPATLVRQISADGAYGTAKVGDDRTYLLGLPRHEMAQLEQLSDSTLLQGGEVQVHAPRTTTPRIASYSCRGRVPTDGAAKTFVQANSDSQKNILFQTIPIELMKRDGTTLSIYAMIDTDEERTLIDRATYDDLGYRGMSTTLKLKWTQDIETRSATSFVFGTKVRGLRKSEWYHIDEMHTMENMDLPVQTMNAQELQTRFAHLRDVPIISYQ